MSLDRFVYFKEKTPTKGEIKKVITNFLGGIGTVTWRSDRFSISLPGKSTHALTGIKGTPRNINRQAHPTRWIEVHRGKTGTIDVITRQADDFTNCIAAGIHEVIMRWWEGSENPQSG